MTMTMRYFATTVAPGQNGKNEYSYHTSTATFEHELPKDALKFEGLAAASVSSDKEEAQELLPLKNIDCWSCTMTADTQLSSKVLNVITGCPNYPPKRRVHCSRKRFKKILMANGFSRNYAEIWCELIAKRWIRSYAEPAKFYTFLYR